MQEKYFFLLHLWYDYEIGSKQRWHRDCNMIFHYMKQSKLLILV